MRGRTMFIAAAALLTISQLALGAGVWVGGGADNNWSTAANWDDGLVPAVDGLATFGNSATSVNLSANQTVGKLLFSIDGGYTIARTGGTLTIGTGIEVNPSLATPNTYTINAPIALSGPADFIIGAGSTLYTSGAVTGSTINVSGAGTWEFSRTSGVKVTAAINNNGTIKLGQGNRPGAYFSGLTGSGTIDLYGEWLNLKIATDNEYTGQIISTEPGESYPRFVKDGLGTFKVSGTGVLKSAFGIYMGQGTIELDNTATNVNDRLLGWGCTIAAENGAARMLVRGNATEATTDDVYIQSMDRGMLTIEGVHGETANLVIDRHNYYNTYNGGMLRFAGNDLGGTGTYTTRIAGYYNQCNLYGGILGGNAYVGDEFASYNFTIQSIVPYTDAARPTLIASGTVNADNVLVSGDQLLTDNTTINSLKIDGNAKVDLGGKTLTLARGGLIQTGSANVQGIVNGTLAPNFSDGNSLKYLYVNNSSDLVINATIAGNGLSKAGTGKLSFTGSLGGTGLNWFEGDLEINSPSNMTLRNRVNGPYSLTKDGTGALTISGDGFQTMQTTGMLDIKGGTVILTNQNHGVTGGLQVGGGIIVRSGATLDVRQDFNGPSLQMAGGKIIFGGYGKYLATTLTVDFAAGTTNELFVQHTAFGWPGYLYNITGSGTIKKTGLNTGDTYYGGLWFRGAAGTSSFSGNIDVAEGFAKADANAYPPNVNTLTVRSGAIMKFGYSPTIADDTFAGNGVISMSGYTDFSDTWADGTITAENTRWTPHGATAANVGILTMRGGLSFTSTNSQVNTLVIDVTGSGAVAGVDFDALQVLKPSLNGTDTITNLVNLALVVNVGTGLDLAGDVLTVLTCGSDLTGLSFASVTVNGGSMLADVLYGVGGASLTNIRNAVVIKMGDADGDTFVDDDDLSLLLSNWKGGDVGWGKGDFNASGDVDDDDLSLLLSNWTGSGGGTIPEPATIGLLILGGIGLIRRRK